MELEGGMIVLSQTIRVTQKITPKLVQTFGETFGDIPLYSLHRIKGMMTRKKIGVSKDSEILLRRQLLLANEKYKSESGNNWSCLTPNNLIEATDGFDSRLKDAVESIIIGQPAEMREVVEKLVANLHQTREKNVSMVKQWFITHGDNLLYDLSSKIPWAIVKRLRIGLSLWATGAHNPFNEEIEEAILRIAEEENIVAEDSEEAWIRMGGHLFK